jgi:hypothetical protein
MADIVSMADIACNYESGAAAVTGPTQDDLARLREEHPGWNFGTVWTTVNSGPDQRRIWASRNGILLSAWNAAELSRDIGREQASEPEREGETSP